MAQPLKFVATVAGAASRYREFAPAADLHDVVVCTWAGESAAPRTMRVLPDGCCDVSWNGDHLVVARARAGVTYHRIPAARVVAGIRLAPWAAELVLGLDPPTAGPAADPRSAGHDDLVAEVCCELRAIGDDETGLRRALEELVRQRMASRAEPGSLIATAVRRLGDNAPIGQVADEMGVSVRSFRDRFRASVGLGPQAFRRTIRFHQFVSAVRAETHRSPSLAELAATHGYADQAHLSRECRHFAAATPTDLVRHLGKAT